METQEYHLCLKICDTETIPADWGKPQVILSALCPLLCNSTRPQHTLQMFADHCGPRQTISWETINQGLLQPQGELYPIQTIFNHRSRDQLLEFRTSFYETISSEFLVQGNFKHTQFSREHWHWREKQWLHQYTKIRTNLTAQQLCYTEESIYRSHFQGKFWHTLFNSASGMQQNPSYQKHKQASNQGKVSAWPAFCPTYISNHGELYWRRTGVSHSCRLCITNPKVLSG